jgi:hypothetical protein
MPGTVVDCHCRAGPGTSAEELKSEIVGPVETEAGAVAFVVRNALGLEMGTGASDYSKLTFWDCFSDFLNSRIAPESFCYPPGSDFARITLVAHARWLHGDRCAA